MVHQEAAGDNAMRKAAIQPHRRAEPTWENHFGRNRKRRSAGSHQCAAKTIVSGKKVAVRSRVESKYTKVSKKPPEG
jgi:hypothetical protein